MRAQNWARAIAHLRVVVAARPDAAVAWAQLAFGLAALARHADARRAAETALTLDPNLADAWNVLGVIEQESGDAAAARGHYARALALAPGHARARLNLANADRAAGHFDAALAGYHEALAMDPRDAEIHHALGHYEHTVTGNMKQAVGHYREALAHEPQLALARHHLSHALLLLDRLDEAWQEHVARPPRARLVEALRRSGRDYEVPALESLATARVALIAEQGLGDTLFFLRFAAPLRAAGAALQFAGDERLHAMLLRTGLFESAVTRIDETDARSVPILVGDLPLMSPARALKTLTLAPLPDALDAARQRLAALGPGPYVALAWRAGEGARGLHETLRKEIRLEALGRSVRSVAATWLSVQRESRAGELDALAAALGRPVHDFSDVNRDLEAALATLALIDELVGVSSTNVHLRESTGRTSRVLVPFPPEWRWMATGDSPWFPSTSIYRQASDGRWDVALERLRADLAAVAIGRKG